MADASVQEQMGSQERVLTVDEIKELKDKGDTQWARHAGRQIAGMMFAIYEGPDTVTLKMDALDKFKRLSALVANISASASDPNSEFTNFMEGIADTHLKAKELRSEEVSAVAG